MNKFVLDKDQSVLMVIDIQDRLVPAMKTKIADKVIKNTNILISSAKELGMPILTTEQYPRGLGSTVLELRENIDPKYVFEKNSFTAYTDEVAKTLQELDKKKIIITGMETHICIFQTIRDLLDKGYEVFLTSDAVCSRKKDNYLNGLQLIENMGAVVTNTETIVFDLLKAAGTPEFKTLSSLIK